MRQSSHSGDNLFITQADGGAAVNMTGRPRPFLVCVLSTLR
jgi:hypothetical protein